MTKLAPTSEQYQHFLNNLRGSFWGDVYGTIRLAWKKFWEQIQSGSGIGLR